MTILLKHPTSGESLLIGNGGAIGRRIPPRAGFRGSFTTSTTPADDISGETFTFDRSVQWAQDVMGQPAVRAPASGILRLTATSTPSTTASTDGRKVNGLMVNPYKGAGVNTQGWDAGPGGLYDSGNDYSDPYADSQNSDPGNTGHPIALDFDNDRYSADGESTWIDCPNLAAHGCALNKCISQEDHGLWSDGSPPRIFATDLIPLRIVPHSVVIPARFSLHGQRGDQSKVRDFDQLVAASKALVTPEMSTNPVNAATKTPLRSAGYVTSAITKRAYRILSNGLEAYGKATQITFNNALAELLNPSTTDADRESILAWVVDAAGEIAALVEDGDTFNADGGHNLGALSFVAYLWKLTDDPDLLTILQENENWQEVKQAFVIGQEHVGVFMEDGIGGDNYPRFSQEHVGLPWYSIQSPEIKIVSNASYLSPRQYGGMYAHYFGDAVAMFTHVPGVIETFNDPAIIRFFDSSMEYSRLENQGVRTRSRHSDYGNPDSILTVWDNGRDNVPIAKLSGLQPYPAFRPMEVDVSAVEIVLRTDESILLNGGTLQQTDVEVKIIFGGETGADWDGRASLAIPDVTVDGSGYVTIPDGTLPGGYEFAFSFVYVTEQGRSAFGNPRTATVNASATAPAIAWEPPSIDQQIVTDGMTVTVSTGVWTGEDTLSYEIQSSADDGETWATETTDAPHDNTGDAAGTIYRARVTATCADTSFADVVVAGPATDPKLASSSLAQGALSSATGTAPSFTDAGGLAGRTFVYIQSDNSNEVIPVDDNGDPWPVLTDASGNAARLQVSGVGNPNYIAVRMHTYPAESPATEVAFEVSQTIDVWAIREITDDVPAVVEVKTQIHNESGEASVDMSLPAVDGGLWFGAGCTDVSGGVTFDGDAGEIANTTGNAQHIYEAMTSSPYITTAANAASTSTAHGSISISVSLR